MEKILGTRFLKASLMYFAISVTVGAIMTIQPVYTFVVLSALFERAHAHVSLIGWVSMSIIGFIYLAIDYLNRPMYSTRLGNMGFWLLNIGIMVEFVVLMTGGYYQSHSFMIGDPYAHGSSAPYVMFVMTFAFVMMIGAYMTIYNIYKTLK
jgi:cbb3-type cytochrome oxidase subunit 1